MKVNGLNRVTSERGSAPKGHLLDSTSGGKFGGDTEITSDIKHLTRYDIPTTLNPSGRAHLEGLFRAKATLTNLFLTPYSLEKVNKKRFLFPRCRRF